MKKWLLSKLLFLLGFSTFAQVFQQDQFQQNNFPNPMGGQVVPEIDALLPGTGEVGAELAAHLQATLDSLGNAYGAIGLSAALLLPGDDLWAGTTGINSTMPGDTLSTEMRLGMGSVTKTFTAAVIMQLVGEGVMTLEDSIGHWLPSYPNVDSSIAIRHLLNHTSGIYNYTDSPAFWDYGNNNLDSIISPQFVLENFVDQPVFTTGATWGYSNTNYMLLGLIIESATGNVYHEEIRTRLLEPFGHATMTLHPYETPTGDMAHLWLDITGDNLPDDVFQAGITLNSIFSGAWAAGALLATPSDLVYWVKNLMTGQVVDQDLLDQMMVTEPVGLGFSYGLGLSHLQVSGSDWWGHTGGIFYQTWAFYSPTFDMGMVLMTHDASAEQLDVIYFEMVQTYLTFMPTANAEVFGNEMDLLAFPNPFSTDLLLAFDLPQSADLQLTVTNQLGQVVYEMGYDKMPQGMNNIRLENTGHWSAGIYNVELMGADWMMVEQVIKE